MAHTVFGAIFCTLPCTYVALTSLSSIEKEEVRLHKNNCAFVYLHLTELKLITRPVTTTTPTPYVYTTVKPRRKQHQSHNHKGHDTSNRVKEILLPNNLQENEIVGAAAGGSIEGMYRLQNITMNKERKKEQQI